MHKIPDRFWYGIIWIFIVIYVIYFTCANCFRYKFFLYHDMDLAIFNQLMWNTIHGNFLYSSIRGGIIFKDHIFAILLLLSPIYAIFQHPATLLFLQSLFLGLGALPIYILAKENLNRPAACAFAFLYLIYPPVWYANLYDFHPEVLLTVILPWAFLCFNRGKFKWFLISMGLALLCKEDVSLIIFMFGIYAIIIRRSRRWVLVPAITGLVYLLVSFKVIIPYFNKGGYIFTSYYAALGKDVPEIIRNILSHPVSFIRFVFSPQKQDYLFHLFAPLSFVSLLSPLPLLMALPTFAENLLSGYGPLYNIYYYYTSPITPFIFISSIYGVKKLLSLELIKKQYLLIIFLLLSGLYMNSLIGPRSIIFPAVDYNSFLARQDLLNSVPRDAPIVATFDFLPKLSSRKEVYSFHYVYLGWDKVTGAEYKLPSSVQYALLNFDDALTFRGFRTNKSTRNMERFLEDGKWGVVNFKGSTVLLKKGFKGNYRIYMDKDGKAIIKKFTVDS